VRGSNDLRVSTGVHHSALDHRQTPHRQYGAGNHGAFDVVMGAEVKKLDRGEGVYYGAWAIALNPYL